MFIRITERTLKRIDVVVVTTTMFRNVFSVIFATART